MWNRHKDNKIKSITIRNSSLLFTNIMIISINIIVIASMTMFVNNT